MCFIKFHKGYYGFPSEKIKFIQELVDSNKKLFQEAKMYYLEPVCIRPTIFDDLFVKEDREIDWNVIISQRKTGNLRKTPNPKLVIKNLLEEDRVNASGIVWMLDNYNDWDSLEELEAFLDNRYVQQAINIVLKHTSKRRVEQNETDEEKNERIEKEILEEFELRGEDLWRKKKIKGERITDAKMIKNKPDAYGRCGVSLNGQNIYYHVIVETLKQDLGIKKLLKDLVK
jgi:hypothetical protein